MAPLLTLISRLRSPARSTISAVITLVMLPIGRGTLTSLAHSTAPVRAFTRSAPRTSTRGSPPFPDQAVAGPGPGATIATAGTAAAGPAMTAAADSAVTARRPRDRDRIRRQLPGITCRTRTI